MRHGRRSSIRSSTSYAPFKRIVFYEQLLNKKYHRSDSITLNTYLRLYEDRLTGVINDLIYIVVSLSLYVNTKAHLLIPKFCHASNAIKYVLNMEETLLTAEEVASKLRLTPSTVWTKAKSGQLPGFKLGKRWLFRSKDIDSYIRKQKRLYGSK